MAKTALYNDLFNKISQVQASSFGLKQSVVKARQARDEKNQAKFKAAIAAVDRLFASTNVQLKGLDTAIKNAESHIAGYANESKWKKRKNVLIPKLTEGRDRLKAQVATAKRVDAAGKMLTKQAAPLAAYSRFSK